MFALIQRKLRQYYYLCGFGTKRLLLCIEFYELLYFPSNHPSIERQQNARTTFITGHYFDPGKKKPVQRLRGSRQTLDKMLRRQLTHSCRLSPFLSNFFRPEDVTAMRRNAVGTRDKIQTRDCLTGLTIPVML